MEMHPEVDPAGPGAGAERDEDLLRGRRNGTGTRSGPGAGGWSRSWCGGLEQDLVRGLEQDLVREREQDQDLVQDLMRGRASARPQAEPATTSWVLPGSDHDPPKRAE